MVELKCIESDYVFIISETDKPYIEKYSWHYWKNNKGIEFISTRINNRTIYLHDVIMMRRGIKQPSKKHIVCHVNKNTLDNRRENIVWMLKNRRYKQC